MRFILELKNRITLFIVFELNLCFICYFYKEILYYLSISNLICLNNDIYFLHTSIIDIIGTYIIICNFLICQFNIIYLFYNILCFVIPGLYTKEKFFLTKFLTIIINLVICSLFFVFYLVVPTFFLVFSKLNAIIQIDNINYLEIKIIDYLTFFKQIYYFSLINLILIISFFLVKLNFYFNITYLTKHKKIYYFTLLSISVLITFDLMINLFIFAVFFILFEFCCFALFFQKHILFKTKR